MQALLLNLLSIIMFGWLVASVFFRFRKKPLSWEHGLVKLWKMNNELGQTRYFETRDCITIGLTLFPIAMRNPDWSKVITAFFIMIIVHLLLHSATLIAYRSKHPRTQWYARASLLVTFVLFGWTIVEITRVIA